MVAQQSVELVQAMIQQEIRSLFDRYTPAIVFNEMASVATQVFEISPAWNGIWYDMADMLEEMSGYAQINADLCDIPCSDAQLGYEILVGRLNFQLYGTWSKRKPDLELKMLPPGRD